MRHALLLFICGLYLFAASGLRLSVHFCHGHFQSISLNADLNEDACCSRKKMKKHKCCNDKVVEIKIKDDQKAPAAFSVTLSQATTADQPLTDTGIRLYSTDSRHYSPHAHAPPPDPISILIMNGTFRI